MNIKMFFQLNPETFLQQYPDEASCVALLSHLKWGDGFICKRCGHTHYCEGKYPGSRRCTKCKAEETLKSHTIFMNCKLPLQTSMLLMLYAWHHPQTSSAEMCRKFGVRQMTCWRMKHIVKEIQTRGL